MSPPSSIPPAPRRGAVLLLVTGLLLVLAALWLTPERLHRPGSAGALVRFQLALVLLGAVLAGVGAWALRRRRGLPAVLALALLLIGGYRVSFARAYPRNVVFSPSGLLQVWHVVTGQDLALDAYDPRPMLQLESHEPIRAKFAAFNVHSHFGKLAITPAELFAILDSCGVSKVVSLDGQSEDDVRRYRTEFQGRVIVFRHLWFPVGAIKSSYFDTTLARMERAVPAGARGVKIWKNLGLHTRDGSGKLVTIDDPRMDRIYQRAGELHIPVMMHVGDPLAFFQPFDGRNERYEQLRGGFAWSIAGQHDIDPDAPSQQELVAEFGRAVGKHPGTTFIGAHMLFMSDDLAGLGTLLDQHPNLYLDISADVPELGREPYTARAFFIRYQDRLLFATDAHHKYIGTRNYRAYFRFLETFDEYFDYPFRELRDGGQWKIYGLGLPDSVLKKLYATNPTKVIDFR